MVGRGDLMLAATTAPAEQQWREWELELVITMGPPIPLLDRLAGCSMLVPHLPATAPTMRVLAISR